jgi:hypothetical protein
VPLDGDPHFDQAPDGIGWRARYRFCRPSDGQLIDLDVSCTAAAIASAAATIEATRGARWDISDRGLQFALRLAEDAEPSCRTITVAFDPGGGNPRVDYDYQE